MKKLLLLLFLNISILFAQENEPYILRFHYMEVSSGQNESAILKLAEEQGFKTISESGQRFLMDGTVSVEEYLRVIPKDE